jgi:4-alpha-glucanotransferase
MPNRTELRQLCARLGVLDGYRATDGRWRTISESVRAELCRALGHPAATEAEAARSRRELALRDRERVLDANAVVFSGAAPSISVQHATGGRFELCVRDAAGQARESGGRAVARRGRVSIALPRLGVGEHRVSLRIRCTGGVREAEQTLWVAPPACPSPRELLGPRRAFGLWANLYALRSDGGVGVGHFGDLRALVRFAARAGADFVGSSPLHALRNCGHEISPYAPLTRLFRNPLYLDLDAVPETAECRKRGLLPGGWVRSALAASRAARWIDYERSARLLEEMLAPVHAQFLARASTWRRREFAEYCEREGQTLTDFATFAVLDTQLAADGLARDFRTWPPALRDPRSPAVSAFRARHRRSVERQRFVQFELDRQLGAAASEAHRRGLAIGLYTDLALGSAPSGFDSWAFPDFFALDIEVGAPPDAFNRAGQAWGFPPLNPRRLLDGGLALFARLLRANLRHAGALRIDHILGLFRQWWVPAGRSPREGGYVRFPTRELLGLIALEAQRAGALVIGEDLGTIPPQVAPTLRRRGILSSRVLLFERDRAGRFKPAKQISSRALLTANTHDLPTLAGWFSGRDLEIRRALGSMSTPAYRRALRVRQRECAALLERLRREAALDGSEAEPAPAERLCAVNRFLCATGAPLVGVAVDDLAFEAEPVNIPGVSASRYPCWRRRLEASVSQLARSAQVRRALEGTASRRLR